MIEKHLWKTVNSTSTAKPSPRWGHSCCIIGDQLVLFGGYADSIYMNDIWVYHTSIMNWTEIKTFGDVPSHRSNSSLHYDSNNNRIIMFGGGGSNKTRFNSIHFLDWNTKIWTQLKLKQNQNCPWQRTYHSSELVYPYLIVYGGQGVSDLDDLWTFNLETLKWTQLLIEASSSKPCGRRFHSSCVIQNNFFVIAGCYSKYRPLSDIYSIDLTNYIKQGSQQGLKWKEVQLNGSSFLTRWGHACASLENKIYIFGGRFSNDLNDLLVLDLDTHKLRTLKASPQTIPKPRRRACINFIGNCLLMFGGFNSDYFNDLHFINVSEGMNKPKKYSKNYELIQNFVNKKELSDLTIQTKTGQNFYCHKGLLMSSFSDEQKLNDFLQKISKKQSKQFLNQLMGNLYKGFGKNQIISKYRSQLPQTQQQKQIVLIKQIQKIKDKWSPNTNIFTRKNIIKVLNNNIIQLSDDQFGDYLQLNRENSYRDLDLIINNNFVVKSNSIALSCASKFFRYQLSTKFKNQTEQLTNRKLEISLPKGNVVLMQIILNFIQTGFLIVPQGMSYQSWMDLYQLADYLSLVQIKQILLYLVWSKLSEVTVEKIFEFSIRNNLDELSLACSKLKLKSIQLEIDKFQNKYHQMAYQQNKFQIKQKILSTISNPFLKKKISQSSTIEGEKQNYEIYNQ